MRAEIALISFAWMCEQVTPYLQLDVDLHSLAGAAMEERRNLIDSALVKMSRPETGRSGNRLTDKASGFLNWTGLKKTSPKQVSSETVHGWATGPLVDSFTGTLVLAGSTVRTPGRYEVEQSSSIEYDQSREATREMIHPSVAYRMRKKVAGEDRYQPKALAGFERRPIRTRRGRGLFEWSNGDCAIPEYRIRTDDVFSRRLASGDASLFLNEIDQVVA